MLKRKRKNMYPEIINMHTPYGVVVVVVIMAASKLRIRPELMLIKILMLSILLIRYFRTANI